MNANENPMGPCPEAAEAMRNMVQKGGRYMYQLTEELAQTMAAVEGVKSEYVRPFAGSSAPLHQAVLAYCSPQKSYVCGDPGYEAGGRAAKFIGAKAINVPLTKRLRARRESHGRGGSERRPDLSMQSEQPHWIAHVARGHGMAARRISPKGSILMVDEAYIHIADGASTMVDMAAKDKDMIVLRTFSKLYGMAGLRAGAAIGRPDLLEKMHAL